MRRWTVWIGLTLLLASPVGGWLQAQSAGLPDALGFSSERLQRIDRMMREAVDSNRVPGAAVMVLRRGKIAYQGAWGWADREVGRRMTTDVVFRIASQSKAVTSVAVMMLLEEGRLTLNDPVSKWIPAFKDARVATASDTGRVLTPVKRAITIRDLLTHTAGISYGYDSLVRDDYTAAGLGPDVGPRGRLGHERPQGREPGPEGGGGTALEGAAPQHGHAAGRGLGGQLLHQSGLADAGLALDQHHPGRRLGLAQRGQRRAQLGVPPHQPRPGRQRRARQDTLARGSGAGRAGRCRRSTSCASCPRWAR